MNETNKDKMIENLEKIGCKLLRVDKDNNVHVWGDKEIKIEKNKGETELIFKKENTVISPKAYGYRAFTFSSGYIILILLPKST